MYFKADQGLIKGLALTEVQRLTMQESRPSDETGFILSVIETRAAAQADSSDMGALCGKR